MTGSPEEVARQSLAALPGGDPEALVALCDPEVEVRPLIAGVEGGASYQGHEGVRRWFAELSSGFDERRPDLLEVETIDDDSVIGKVDLHLRGRGSGIEIDLIVYGVARLREGRLLWWGFFEDREEALRELATTSRRGT